jgi:hypothetical protein
MTSTTRALVPDQPNGKPDWLAISRGLLQLLPVVVMFVGMIFYFSDRMQTRVEKKEDFTTWLAPTRVEINALFEAHRMHVAKGGHEEMEARMAVIEAGFNSITKQLDRIVELLEPPKP